jgi:hypothetical protein
VASQNLVRRLLDPRDGRVVREVRTALANRDSVPLRRQVAAWRRGFYAETLQMYDLQAHDLDDYISDYERVRTLATINEARHVLDDKLVTYLYLSQVGVPTPTVYAQVHDGRLFWLSPEPPRGGSGESLERRGKLAVKARAGSSGSGFAVLSRSEGVTRVDGRPVGDPVRELGRGSLIVSDYVEQHEQLAAIYPGTTNTMRLVTFRDVDTGEPFVAFASQRFGTRQSQPVDNVRAGGITVGIDLATGTYTRAVRPPQGKLGNTGFTWFDEHPETGTRITDVPVPHWDLVCDGVLRDMPSGVTATSQAT